MQPPISTRPQIMSGSYEDLFNQARQKLNQQDFDGAVVILNRIYARLDKMNESVRTKRENLKNLYLHTLRTLADIHAWQDNPDEAVAFYEKLITTDPEQATHYRHAIAEIKIDNGQAEAGLDELRALTVANPDEAWLRLALGVELYGQEEYDEAEQSLKRVIEHDGASDSDKYNAHTYLFDIYQDQTRYEEAEEIWLRSWGFQASKSVEDVSPLYQMYWEKGDLEKANHWLDQEKNRLRNGFYRGLFYQAEGDTKRAQSTWQRTAKLDPLSYDEGQESWAEAALRADVSPDSILEVLGQLGRQGQLSLRGYLLLSVVQARRDDIENARSALEAVLTMLRRTRPRQTKLASEHWTLFQTLVPDEDIHNQLSEFFELDSETDSPALDDQTASLSKSGVESEADPNTEALDDTTPAGI